MFSPGRGLAKVVVTVSTNTRNLSDARIAYADAVDALRKYGQPQQHELFHYPFKEGDGDEDLAMSSGKLDIFSIWEIGTAGGDPYGLTVDIERNMDVEIDYESQLWHAESARRKQSSTSDL